MVRCEFTLSSSATLTQAFTLTNPSNAALRIFSATDRNCESNITTVPPVSDNALGVTTNQNSLSLTSAQQTASGDSTGVPRVCIFITCNNPTCSIAGLKFSNYRGMRVLAPPPPNTAGTTAGATVGVLLFILVVLFCVKLARDRARARQYNSQIDWNPPPRQGVVEYPYAANVGQPPAYPGMGMGMQQQQQQPGQPYYPTGSDGTGMKSVNYAIEQPPPYGTQQQPGYAQPGYAQPGYAQQPNPLQPHFYPPPQQTVVYRQHAQPQQQGMSTGVAVGAGVLGGLMLGNMLNRHSGGGGFEGGGSGGGYDGGGGGDSFGAGGVMD